MNAEGPREAAPARKTSELEHAPPQPRRTFSRRIDCSEPEDEGGGKAPRPPARSDGARRENGAGGRRSAARRPPPA